HDHRARRGQRRRAGVGVQLSEEGAGGGAPHHRRTDEDGAGRSAAAAAAAARVENGKTLLFVGAASGGVWKSSDGGTTFKPVFDKERVQSIGAITIDPTNPKTIWVGTGEGWTRNSTSIGDGIY